MRPPGFRCGTGTVPVGPIEVNPARKRLAIMSVKSFVPGLPIRGPCVSVRAASQLLLAALLLVGCQVGSGPSLSPGAAAFLDPVGPSTTAPAVPSPPDGALSPGPTPSPTATSVATPTSSAPASLPLVAVAERDGVRVKIELERNPMPAGKVTRVRTTVRNLGDDTLHWFSDGCSAPVYVSAEPDLAWRPGATQAGSALEFKERVLDLRYRQGPPPGPLLVFRPEDWLGRGSYGCADIGITHDIPAGEAIHETRAWDGMAALRWGPFPTGPIRLSASFDWYWRGGQRNQPDWPDIPTIELSLDTWVTDGAGDGWLSPPEVVDAALADPGFRAWIDTLDLGNGIAEVLWYRPELGAWEVGAITWVDSPGGDLVHVVLVDPRTGKVLDTIDRPWDSDRDGVP